MDFLKQRVIPVATFASAREADETLLALAQGGLPVVEITLRTPEGLEAIRRAQSLDPALIVGAGTVMTEEQADAAILAGARFIVGPGLSDIVASVCADAGVPYLPGCVTPTEIQRALDLGLSTLKFFPASVFGGAAAIRALSGPFPQVRFVPTGGIGAGNLAEYLACPAVAAVGGTWMTSGNVAAHCARIRAILG